MTRSQGITRCADLRGPQEFTPLCIWGPISRVMIYQIGTLNSEYSPTILDASVGSGERKNEERYYMASGMLIADVTMDGQSPSKGSQPETLGASCEGGWGPDR